VIELVIASASVLWGSVALVARIRVPPGHRLSAVILLSLIVVVASGLTLGSLGWYRAEPLLRVAVGYALAATGFYGLARRPRPIFFRGRREPGRGRAVVNVAAGGLLVAALIEYAWRAALAVRLPPLGYGALSDRLATVEQWMVSATLGPPLGATSARSNPSTALIQADRLPKNTETVAAWSAVFTHSMRYVGLTQLVFVLLAASSVAGICRALSIRADLARLAGIAAPLVPGVVAQSSELYIDVAQVATALVAFEFIVLAVPRAAENGPTQTRHMALVLAGASLGLAAGVESSNLVFVPISLVVIAGLVVGQHSQARRAGTPPGRSTAGAMAVALSQLMIPALLVGSYWYVRAGVLWGRSGWTFALNPLNARLPAANPNHLDATALYGTNIPALALVHGWWKAIYLFQGRVSGDSRQGSLGLIWLVVGIPAVLVLIVRRRCNRRALFAVIGPIGLGTLAAPMFFDSRFGFALPAVGLVGAAAVLDAIVRGHWRRRSAHGGWVIQPGRHRLPSSRPPSFPPRRRRARSPRRFGSNRLAGPAFGLVVLSVTALAGTDAWSATRFANWDLNPGQDHRVSLAQEVSAVRGSSAQRTQLGFTPLYAATLAKLDSTAPIGFFADEPPSLTYPLTGPRHDHRLVVLPSAGTDAGRAVALARAARVRYLVLPTGSSLAPASGDVAVSLIGPVWQGNIVELNAETTTAGSSPTG
jgi:hypothetical protein